jgi:putative DNA primase/helicase
MSTSIGINPPSAETTAQPPAFSDDDLALRFSALYADVLRYTAATGRWYRWTDDNVWKHDETLAVFDLARALCRGASSLCYDPRVAPRIAGAGTIAAVERLARSDRRHAATVDQWDRDPWLLNTPAGVVDLRTGTLRAAAREDYCTKITAVAPGGDCPLWMAILARLTDGDPEYQRHLQSLCGYVLTGITREQAAFFVYGTGANSKSVFLNTFSGLMGDYARTAPIETFLASLSERHPTDLAALQGARLVTAVESEVNRHWDEAKIKVLTGGERIAARFMRQDFFEFVPEFKLILAGNHKPRLHTVDEAMRRRFNLLPFTVTIPAAERDLELADKLRQEWPGILQWAIDGCLAWQREGLKPPAVVQESTTDYLTGEDVLGLYLKDRCKVGQSCHATAAVLFASWRDWCARNGEYAGSQKAFSQALETRGFVRVRSANARLFVGLELRSDDEMIQ